MSDNPKKAARTLSEDARELALDSAAATLAAIQMAKQVGADIPRRGALGLPSLTRGNARLRLGDIVFGAAQLQVDFARRLFEFNRNSSVLLRDRLRGTLDDSCEKTIKERFVEGETPILRFSVKNSALLTRTLTFRASKDYKVDFTPASVTLAQDKCADVVAKFRGQLKLGLHRGEIVVESLGVRVEVVRFEITIVGKAAASAP